MVQVKRKKSETFDALLRRFQRRFQDSGQQLETKRRRFKNPGKSRNHRRDSALRRVRVGTQYQYLLKTGQLKKEDVKRGGRRS